PAGAYGGGLAGYLNPANGARYAAWIFPEGSPGGSTLLKLIKFKNWKNYGYNGVNSAPMQQVNLGTVGTIWHTLRLSFSGNLTTVYYDGIQKMSVTDVEAAPYSSGAISLDLQSGSKIYNMSVDNVVVSNNA